MCKICGQYWQPFSTHQKSQECTHMSTQPWDCTVVSETNITVSQWTKSKRKCHMTNQRYYGLTKWLVGSVLLLGHWSAHCFLVLASMTSSRDTAPKKKSPPEKWPCAELWSAKCRCSLVPRLSTPQNLEAYVFAYCKRSKTGGIEGLGTRLCRCQDQDLVASDLWCSSCREYKSKFCSLEFIHRHGYLREST